MLVYHGSYSAMTGAQVNIREKKVQNNPDFRFTK